MRKFTFLISLLLLLSLLLVACGGAEENNEGTAAIVTPGTGLETETVPGLEQTQPLTPAVTQEPTMVATEVTTQAVSPTVAETQTLSSTPAPVLPGTGVINPSRLSNLLGLGVQNAGGEQLGSAKDFVIDLGKSQVNYMILASGGILGIGEKLVPVPWDAVQIDPNCGGTSGNGSTGGTGTTSTGTPASGGTETTGTPAAGGTGGTTVTGTPSSGGTRGTSANLQGECFILVNVDQQTLENAPNVDLSSIPNVSVENWDQEFKNYWNSFDMGTGGNQLVTSTPAAGGMTGTSTPAPVGGTGTVTPAAGGGTGNVTGTGTPAVGGETGTMTVSQLSGMILASDLLGLQLVSRNGDQLGEVQDAILDLQTGEVRYLLISADASLDIAGNWVPVPLAVLGRGSDNGLVLDTSNDAMSILVNAPNFAENSMPDTRSSDWDSEISSYWNTITR